MSYNYWNPPEQAGRTYNDAMVFGQRYYDWTETPKYRNNEHWPTNSRGYPRLRDNLQLRRSVDVYRNRDLMPNGAARIHKLWNYNDSTSINYLREVYPPTYYEMYG